VVDPAYKRPRTPPSTSSTPTARRLNRSPRTALPPWNITLAGQIGFGWVPLEGNQPRCAPRRCRCPVPRVHAERGAVWVERHHLDSAVRKLVVPPQAARCSRSLPWWEVSFIHHAPRQTRRGARSSWSTPCCGGGQKKKKKPFFLRFAGTHRPAAPVGDPLAMSSPSTNTRPVPLA